MCRRVESVRPERERHPSMDEHGACAVVEGAQDPFGTSVLQGSVGAGEAQDNTAYSKEGAKGSVVKLASIISLEHHDRPAKLRLHKSMERNERGEDVGFASQRERSNIVRVVIKHNEIILKTGVTDNRRCPNVAVHEAERERRNRARIIERKPNMFANATRDARMFIGRRTLKN